MVELLALYVAGLSFFFAGVAGISENLRQLSGQRFRQLLSRATNHPLRAGLLGVVAGAATQSSSVVAVVLAGMIASGLIPLARALIVLASSSLGTALLVFIAALNLHLPVLFLIGLSGLILAFRLYGAWRPGVAGLLSFGLVFFGLDLMKQAFSPLSTSKEMLQVAHFFNSWPDMAFFLGALLRTFIHSSSSVAAITVTINKSGILDEFPAMMSMAGLGVGTAVATYALSSNLRGIQRQIALYQVATNIAAGTMVALLLLLERWTHLPLLLALLHRLSPTIPGRMAYMYLLFNVAIVLVSLTCLRWAPDWLQRISPATQEENLSRPMYIGPELLDAPETALDLVALEQLRLIAAMESYMNAARGDRSIGLASLHAAVDELARQISDFLESLVKTPISRAMAARVISYQRKEETLRSLEENIFEFARALEAKGHADRLIESLIEALDTIVLTARDALVSRDAMDIDMLMQMTRDRGGMMETLRNRHRVDDEKDAEEVYALHYATTLFERNVWLLRQLALWIREDAALDAT